MVIGIPKEIKDHESRVAITPAGVHALVRSEHRVLLERNAGVGSGFPDALYREAGAQILESAAEVWETAEMVMKVKEPLPSEYGFFRPGLVLFTYLHLAAEPELTKALLKHNVIAIGYETIQLADGTLPLLAPMSEIAGRMSVQIGAHLLEIHSGGKGTLLGGVPGVSAAEVTILGGGIVGVNAAKMAIGMGARVTIIDQNVQRLRYLDDLFAGRIQTLVSNEYTIAAAVKRADLVIGAVLIPGSKAPKLVTEETVQQMDPGSVIVDVAVDQGGSIATIDRLTSHTNPTYQKFGVLHYAVPNMPGAVARTSTLALTNATLPYALQLTNKGYLKAVRDNPSLRKGLNVMSAQVTCEAVANSLDIPFTPFESIVNGVAV